MRHKVCSTVFDVYYVALTGRKTGDLRQTTVAPTIPEALNLNKNAEYVAIVRVSGEPTDLEDSLPNRKRTYPEVTIARIEPWTKMHSVRSAIIAAEDAYHSVADKDKPVCRAAIDAAKAWVADPSEANRAAAEAAARAAARAAWDAAGAAAAAARAAAMAAAGAAAMAAAGTAAMAAAAWAAARAAGAAEAAAEAAWDAAYARINDKILKEVFGVAA